MAKMRQLQAANLRDRLEQEQVLMYDAILLEKKKRLGGAVMEVPDVGTMLSNGDQRLLAAHLTISLGQQKVATHSFNPLTMLCLCPGEHSKKKLATSGGDNSGGREAFLLTDQSIPAILPSMSSRKCLKIVRVEHARLDEVAAEFANLMKGRYLAAGGAVLLFSATHLAMAGLPGYTADLMHAIEYLKKEIGEHMIYAPLPHYFGAGCQDDHTVRAAAELSAWAADVFGGERCYLKHTFELATNIMVGAGTGGAAACCACATPSSAYRHTL
jgi:hypothetical protein